MTFDVKFIAEVSSNHSQDLDRCLDFVDISAESGATAVKFQLFKIKKLFAREILASSENHRAREKWELPVEFLRPISDRCKEKNVEFSCTPFYLEAVDELEPYVDFYKIASYELLWDELLIRCAQTNKPIVLSTGMATISEVQHAVSTLKAAGCEKPTVLHCTSAYPTPVSDANLSAIKTLREQTGCEVGWSDHTVNPAVILSSILRWKSKCVEFHLDIEGHGPEYDSGHCWLPSEIKPVIDLIRQAALAEGTGEKVPGQAELSDREWRADPVDGLRPLLSMRKRWADKLAE